MAFQLALNEVALILDGGTSTSRLWATRASGEVVVQARVQVGARDGVTDRSPIATAVAGLVADVSARCATLGFTPKVVVAGGMITSASGLFLVPHVVGPTDLASLAVASRVESLPHVCSLPIVFVPGVKFVGSNHDLLTDANVVAAMNTTDLVRGEELLCLGLAAQGLLPAGGSVISLGSHWKRLDVDAQSQLIFSRSSLSGELVAAVSANTILAESLPHPPADELDLTWLMAGAQAARARGLSRAFYEVRLLAVTANTSAEQRYAYLWGATFGADLPHLLPAADTPVFVVGRDSMCQAFCALAKQQGRDIIMLGADAAERAFRYSCLQLLTLRQ